MLDADADGEDGDEAPPPKVEGSLWLFDYSDPSSWPTPLMRPYLPLSLMHLCHPSWSLATKYKYLSLGPSWVFSLSPADL